MIEEKTYPERYLKLKKLHTELLAWVKPEEIPNEKVKELSILAKGDIYEQVKK